MSSNSESEPPPPHPPPPPCNDQEIDLRVGYDKK